ncbi:MAG: hypothetical protein AAGE96_23650 [Cyanobacteria bacterium P01_G01_bin.19]
MIDLCPESLPNFGDPQGKHFYLVTNPELALEIKLIKGGIYKSYQIVSLDSSLEATVTKLEEDSHILVISTDQFIKAIPPKLVGKRKVAVMAANSTPTSLAAIEFFLKAIEQTDLQGQQEYADSFFQRLEKHDRLSLFDPDTESTAFLELDSDAEWHEQLGILQDGQQQIVPTGEISVLPLIHGQFDSSYRLPLNGKIAIKGRPIVHSGNNPNRLEQQSIFKQLAGLEDYPVIASIDNGYIVKLTSSSPQAEPARKMLEHLFDLDDNYRIIWELGFGINRNLKLWSGNTAMNEVFGDRELVLHLGLGLTPATKYHIDLLCPNTTVKHL